MDKSARKLDEQDPGMYIVQVNQCHKCNNQLKRDIRDWFYRAQHLSLVPADNMNAWIKSLENQIAFFNAKHRKCQPVQLMRSERVFINEDDLNLYTEFLDVTVQRVRRVIAGSNASGQTITEIIDQNPDLIERLFGRFFQKSSSNGR
jgi:hypothetical protein